MRSGLQQCKDAILNTVGPNARGFTTELVRRVVREEEKRQSKVESAVWPRRGRTAGRRKQAAREGRTRAEERVLLGRVAQDASFLRDLVGSRTQTIAPTACTQQVPQKYITIKLADSSFS